MHGAAIVLYEGAPDYPEVDRWWDIIEKYGVTIFYTSPTAIRMLMKYGEGHLKKHDLSSLELLGSVGEPINPEAWLWYYKNVGGERCVIVDTWRQTETGGIMISPAPAIESVPLKPGSATFPLPGIDADIVNEKGEPVGAGERGLLVIKAPWPGMLLGIYGDPKRSIGPVVTPDEIYFAKKLPKTRSGKIMRRILKAVATNATIGDLTTLEDETSVDEVKKAYEELKKEI